MLRFSEKRPGKSRSDVLAGHGCRHAEKRLQGESGEGSQDATRRARRQAPLSLQFNQPFLLIRNPRYVNNMFQNNPGTETQNWRQSYCGVPKNWGRCLWSPRAAWCDHGGPTCSAARVQGPFGRRMWATQGSVGFEHRHRLDACWMLFLKVHCIATQVALSLQDEPEKEKEKIHALLLRRSVWVL